MHEGTKKVRWEGMEIGREERRGRVKGERESKEREKGEERGRKRLPSHHKNQPVSVNW